MTYLNGLAFLLLAAFLNAIANLLIKKSALSTTVSDYGQFFSLYFLIGIFFFGLNLIFYAKSLKVIPISLAYPILIAIGVIGVSLGSSFFFEEEFNVIKYTGVFFLVIGVFLIAN